MTHSTRIVALSLIVAAAAPARAQLSVAADSTASTSTIAPATVPTVFPVAATDSSTATTASSATAGALGASLTGLRAGVHAPETARPLQPAAAPAHANLGQARAMMVVGVAGLIAGAIIGGSPGTIVMVGGAVVGLFGLYDYLQ